jgi:hypothetical protein
LGRSILQILPRRTAEPDGVGDYATLLADALERSAGLGSVFLQGTLEEVAAPRADRWPTAIVPARRPDELLKSISTLMAQHAPIAVVVHVSLYGYQERGVPMWLAVGLRRWKQRAGSVPLVAIFHELWVPDSLNPLKSSFWAAPAQRFITRSLHELSDAAITTTEMYKRRLDAAQRKGAPQVVVANVFSTVGEPLSVPAIAERPPRLVVFGGEGVSVIARQCRSELRRVLTTAAIGEIVQIGKQAPPTPAAVLGIPVAAKGMLPAPELSKLLQASRLGVLPYGNRSVLGKSTILAAYATHGVVPVALKVTHEDTDGLEANVNYLVASRQMGAVNDLEVMQQNIRGWYTGHSLSIQAQGLAAMIQCRSGRVP